MYIISLADAKELMGKVTDTESNRLDIMVQLLSGRIAQVLNRTLDKLTGTDAVRTEIFHGGRNGRAFLSLRAYPNINTQTIRLYDDTTRAFAGNSLIPSSEYYVEDSTGLLYLLPGHTLMPGVGNIKVMYNGGYPVDKTGVLQLDRSNPIRLAFELQLRFLWQRRDSLGTTAVGHTDSGTVTYTSIELLPDVRASLYAERRWNAGD
jgi:hypothetical protein